VYAASSCYQKTPDLIFPVSFPAFPPPRKIELIFILFFFTPRGTADESPLLPVFCLFIAVALYRAVPLVFLAPPQQMTVSPFDVFVLTPQTGHLFF